MRERKKRNGERASNYYHTFRSFQAPQECFYYECAWYSFDARWLTLFFYRRSSIERHSSKNCLLLIWKRNDVQNMLFARLANENSNII